jgi:hypothetical protein
LGNNFSEYENSRKLTQMQLLGASHRKFYGNEFENDDNFFAKKKIEKYFQINTQISGSLV